MKKASLAREAFLSPATHPLSVLIGVDWADKEHAYAIRTPDGKLHFGSFKHKPDAIRQWVEQWVKQYPNLPLKLCIESSRGSLINALREFKQIEIFPVNPAAMSYFRKSEAHGGGKSDPVDARLILKYLEQKQSIMEPLRQDTPETTELRELTRQRRELVEERVALANQIGALWKEYFPAILELKPARAYTDFVIALVLRYPTLEEAQKAGKTRLRKFFYSIRSREKMEERLETLMKAIPITTDPVILRTRSRLCKSIATQIAALNVSIKGYDMEIKKQVQRHRDYLIVDKLPGASYTTKARIIVSLGDDRNRYDSAESLQAAAGIAPITERSGQSWRIYARWACSKFMKQTFHEYAGLSLTKCGWAKRYYNTMIAKGKSKQMARRALAYKWIRIIYRCWKNNQAYDEAHYLARMTASGSRYASES
jgi:transposase